MVELLMEALRQQPRQPFPPPPPPPILVEPLNNGDIITLTQKFNKLKPPTFPRGLQPLKAEAWNLEIEKLFEVFLCTEEQKVLLATFTLQEQARRWWMLVRNQQTAMAWAKFKEVFYEKYFSQCVRDRKVTEFEQLKQGTMTVAKYEAKFTELARYAPHMVDIEYKNARKFEGGLDVEVLDRVSVLKLEKYVDVLDRSIIAEADVAALKQVKAPVIEWKGKRPGSNFKKHRNNFYTLLNKRQNTRSSTSSSQGTDKPICPECGKRHNGICRRIW
ncbi:uncharacterized protein LOC114265789 [Camellia sinensis]|uniref:uncharacterized protein LOC114265789 n=1 Tax=Camellia sinensis TaxID=4442 RepID=UPI00103591A7|nr:uncharacterized protein LOC114265789 [Camellia sinensis]